MLSSWASAGPQRGHLTQSSYAPPPFSRSLSESSLEMWGSPLLAPQF